VVERREQAFVISQIGAEGTPVRERADIVADYIVAPVAKEFGLEVERSDRDPTPGPITSRILRSLLASRVVVADLTGENPNVYYELCFSHSFGLPVVILIDKSENLPFDIKAERVIPLGDEGTIDMQQGELAKRRLREAFNVVLQEGYKPNSLVTEVAGVQNIENMAPENPIASELTALKQRIDQIYSTVVAPRLHESAYTQADLASLMMLIEALASRGDLTSSSVVSLTTDSTSPRFNAWVDDLKQKYRQGIVIADVEDMPSHDTPSD
jgi:hypothetical protein